MPMMTDSQFLAETIKGYDVSHVFFVPAILPRALAALDDLNVRLVATHSELSAAYMADGYARAGRKPGVCFAQAVGAANLAAGLRDAYLSSSPVVAITGGTHPDSRYRYLYQQLEDFPMFEPVTKFNARVEKLQRLPDLLRQAFRVATTGSPGPVHLEVPGRLGEGIRGEADLAVVIEKQFSHYPAYRQEPDPAAIQEAAALLASAQKPVIVAGGGVTAAAAAAELVELAEALSIPVVVSLNAKDAIPDDHPLAVGLMGTYGRWCANQLAAEADLVFFAGSRAGGHVTDNWSVPRPGTAVIQMDIDAAEIGRNYPARVGLLGDAKLTLRQLIDALPAKPARQAWVQRAQELVSLWHAAVAPQVTSDAAPLRPERICKEIGDFLPANAVVVVDTGHSAIWTGTMLALRSAEQRYIRCAGTLGWGFPGSLGVKCALPERPVLCFTGDGGFYYHLSELETAARLGINVVVLVNNNRSLGQTQRGVATAYGGTYRGHANDLWLFKETNFAAVAESLGCVGIRVEKPAALRPALEKAFAANRPVVIDAVSEVTALPPGPWA